MKLEDKQQKILIIGAGIAGCTLALELEALGCTPTLVDNLQANTSSRVAAGLISPIVPKGVKLTWRFAELFPQVYAYYSKWENKWNEKFVYSLPTVQLHANEQAAKLWQMRANDGEMVEVISGLEFQTIENVKSELGYSLVQQSGRLDMQKFCDLTIQHFEKQNKFWNHHFVHSDLTIKDGIYFYKQEKVDAMVFCEGIGVLQNPFFSELFFNPTAGDILEVEIIGLPQQHILKAKAWLIPIGQNRFLAGSTYHRDNLHAEPKKSDATYLISEIQKITDLPINLHQHKKAVRPTVVDRRPYVGCHTVYRNLWMLNGLGSKGTLLCSLFAPSLSRQILGLAAPAQVSTHRSQ